MHEVQLDVEAMHRKLGVLIGQSPGLRREELRAALIREEAKETVDAIEAGDFLMAIDGLCDLLAVIYGSAVEWGIDLAPFWDEVHRTNMAKENPAPGSPGKLRKPEGWTPPNIRSVLARESAEEPAS